MPQSKADESENTASTIDDNETTGTMIPTAITTRVSIKEQNSRESNSKTGK